MVDGPAVEIAHDLRIKLEIDESARSSGLQGLSVSRTVCKIPIEVYVPGTLRTVAKKVAISDRLDSLNF
jgi:hypothetical protein